MKPSCELITLAIGVKLETLEANIRAQQPQVQKDPCVYSAVDPVGTFEACMTGKVSRSTTCEKAISILKPS